MSLAARADWRRICLCVRQIGRLKGDFHVFHGLQGFLEWLEWYRDSGRVHAHSIRHFGVQQAWRFKLAVINEIFAFPRRQQKQFIEFELAKVLAPNWISYFISSFSYLQLLDLSFNKLIDLSNCNFPMLKSNENLSLKNNIFSFEFKHQQHEAVDNPCIAKFGGSVSKRQQFGKLWGSKSSSLLFSNYF